MPREDLLQKLRKIVGPEGVLDDEAARLTYESDGFPIARSVPTAVVFPKTTENVSRVVSALDEADVAVVARGTGTGLAGGCVAYEGGVIVSTARMKRILQIDTAARLACVEAGVLNGDLTDRVQATPGGERLQFAPDPSSQRASTIGGNAATNAGGIHTLKYGVTTQHILGLEVVLADGRIVPSRHAPLAEGMGPDLPALFCGSEGTLGLITKLWVKLTPIPAAFRTSVAIFDDSKAACRAISRIVASGIVPAAMEMMDGAMVRVVEEAFSFGFPPDAQALVLIELDGPDATLQEQVHQVETICRDAGCASIQSSADPKRRADLWSARKRAFGAIGRISPGYCTQDACVPRSKLAEVLTSIERIGRRYGLRITNVFHAGDGNVHPILLFDEDDPQQVHNVMEASHEILKFCISVGGALSGEHGIGVEKLPLMNVMFKPPAMAAFTALKKALDPKQQLNPGKLIPSDRLSVDLLRPAATNSPGGAL